MKTCQKLHRVPLILMLQHVEITFLVVQLSNLPFSLVLPINLCFRTLFHVNKNEKKQTIKSRGKLTLQENE